MLTHSSRWSHALGNAVVPSRWQATVGGFCAEREGQPVQDLESDVVGDVLPAAGQGGGDLEGDRWSADARRCDRGGPDRPDGGGHDAGAGGGTAVPPRLLRLPPGAVRADAVATARGR